MHRTIRTILVTPYRCLLRLWWLILKKVRRETAVKRVLTHDRNVRINESRL